MSDKQPFEAHPELAKIIEWFAKNVPCPGSEWNRLLSEINKAVSTPSLNAGSLEEAAKNHVVQTQGKVFYGDALRQADFLAGAAYVKGGEEKTEQDDFTKKHLELIWQKIKNNQIHLKIEKMWGGLDMASVKYFVETGTVNGGFYRALNDLLDSVRGWYHPSQSPPTPKDREPDQDEVWLNVVMAVDRGRSRNEKYEQIVENLKSKFNAIPKQNRAGFQWVINNATSSDKEPEGIDGMGNDPL